MCDAVLRATFSCDSTLFLWKYSTLMSPGYYRAVALPCLMIAMLNSQAGAKAAQSGTIDWQPSSHSAMTTLLTKCTGSPAWQNNGSLAGIARCPPCWHSTAVQQAQCNGSPASTEQWHPNRHRAMPAQQAQSNGSPLGTMLWQSSRHSAMAIQITPHNSSLADTIFWHLIKHCSGRPGGTMQL